MEWKSISIPHRKHIYGLCIKNKITKKKKPIDDIEALQKIQDTNSTYI